jgi:hypothetical protein
MKKNDNDMINAASLASRTITRSGIVENDKELVVACGYANSGAFGYFVCWEQQVPHQGNKVMHEYSEVVSFKKKTNERTLHEVLAEFQTHVAARKNK